MQPNGGTANCRALANLNSRKCMRVSKDPLEPLRSWKELFFARETPKRRRQHSLREWFAVRPLASPGHAPAHAAVE